MMRLKDLASVNGVAMEYIRPRGEYENNPIGNFPGVGVSYPLLLGAACELSGAFVVYCSSGVKWSGQCG
jgi:hypothetical protein